MLTRYEQQGICLIDLESPTQEEIQSVVHEYNLDHLAGDDLAVPTVKPRVDFYERYVYIVLHFPALRHTHKTHEQEMDFVVGHEFLITTHYEMIDSLHKFSKVFEMHSLLDASSIGAHAGFLFVSVMKNLYKAVEHELEFVRHDLSDIEHHVFSGEEVAMVSAISRAARDLLNLRQTIEPHREVLHALEARGGDFFGRDFTPYLKSLSNEYYRVHNHIMRLTESLHELRETNNSLLSTKQNETMKRFTVLAFITFPLSLIAAIFQALDATSLLDPMTQFVLMIGSMTAVFSVIVGYIVRRKLW